MLRSFKLVREGKGITFLGWDESGELVRISAFDIRTTADAQWLAKELAVTTRKDAEMIFPPGLKPPRHAQTLEGKFRCIIEHLFARELRARSAAEEVDARPGPILRRVLEAEA